VKQAIMQVVNTVLQDVAQDPKRLDKAMKIADTQISEILSNNDPDYPDPVSGD
jgi:hypothetical protein